MSDPVAAIVDPISTVSGLVLGEVAGGRASSASASAPTPVDPSAQYLAKPRTSGRTEGKARALLEEEKRRRYREYSESLLASAGKAYIGEPTSSPDNAGA